jgi:hypothetical protein
MDLDLIQLPPGNIGHGLAVSKTRLTLQLISSLKVTLSQFLGRMELMVLSETRLVEAVR